MRLYSVAAPTLLLVLASSSPRCGRTPPPPHEPKAASTAPAVTPVAEPEPAVPAPEPEAPVEAPQENERPTVAQLDALDTYVGFSRDGLLFAYSQMSAGAGLPVLSLQSSTTNTVEKVVPLAGMTARKSLIGELDQEGFPRPGVAATIPPELKARLQDGLVHVTFGPAPAVKPWRPLESVPGAQPTGVSIVAVSPDGERIAVRVTARGGGEFGPEAEYRVVKLFE